LISLLGAPILAFLLAYFTKYTVNGEYRFSQNENLPSYLFMCVITSLFLGLIISAEEIVKDRKILKRESFLNLSWFSYLNSKITIMFLISAIQTISFILIGNYILEIKGMTIPYWFVLFTTSCFANLIGLNISSAFTSVITIYILIPFILIPQLLFSGVIVDFDKLHKNSLSSFEYVPVIGNLMTTRWSFEALSVEQFKNNKYERNFFRYDMGLSQDEWNLGYMINALKTDLKIVKQHRNDPDYREVVESNIRKLNFHIGELSEEAGFQNPIHLNITDFDSLAARRADKYLDSLTGKFRQMRKKLIFMKDSVTGVVSAKIGKEGLHQLQQDYQNDQLDNGVLDRLRIQNLVETDSKIIRKYEPAYMIPTSKFGMAHFYAPVKRIGNIQIDTFWFNLLILWFEILLLYLALYFNLLQKLLNAFDKPGIRAITKSKDHLIHSSTD
jgi:hypothetical protein